MRRSTLKKSVAFLAGVGLLWLAGSGAAFAQKIAYVDATKVVENSPQYESVRKTLEEEFSKRDKELMSKQKQLSQLEETLAKESGTASASESQRLEQDIRSRRRELAHAKDEFREDFNMRRNEALNKLRKQVQEVVREIGQQEGIDMIFSDGVVWASKGADISDKVLQRLKETYRPGK